MIEDDATEGMFTWGENNEFKIRPELIIEIHAGLNSMRVYKFSGTPEDPGECYRAAYRTFDGINCPKCESEIMISQINEEQDHGFDENDNECNYMFDNKKLLEMIIEKNKNHNKFFWSDCPHQTIESLLLEVFTNYPQLKFTKWPEYKKIKKLIQKTEDIEMKKINPDHITHEEYKKMSKEADRYLKSEKINEHISPSCH